MPLADYPARLYTSQLPDAMEFTGILYLYQYGIIPSARSDNLRFQGLNLSYIPGCDGQICRVYRQSLSLPSFYGAFGEETGRVVKRIGRAQLVAKCHTVDIRRTLLVAHFLGTLLSLTVDRQHTEHDDEYGE